MKQVAVNSSGRIIKGCCFSWLAVALVDGLRVARAPDFSRAAGHLDLCVGKRMLKGIVPLPESCDRPELRTRECPMRCHLLGPDIHPLPGPGLTESLIEMGASSRSGLDCLPAGGSLSYKCHLSVSHPRSFILSTKTSAPFCARF